VSKGQPDMSALRCYEILLPSQLIDERPAPPELIVDTLLQLTTYPIEVISYALTPAAAALMWQAAPPRMPVPSPATRSEENANRQLLPTFMRPFLPTAGWGSKSASSGKSGRCPLRSSIL